MKKIALLCLLFAAQAQADEWDFAVEINGKSNHASKYCDGTPCNEKNDGFGLELRNYTTWPTIFAIGYFKNSINYDSWYAGVGKTLRLGDKYGIEVGIFGTYMSYKTQQEEHKFLAAAPIIVFDLNSIRINTIYFPAYEDNLYKTGAVWFFQLVVPIRSR